MNRIASGGVVTTSVRIIRADGTIEAPRVVDYRHPSRLRRAVVAALLQAGDVLDPATLPHTTTRRLFWRLVRRYRG